MEKSYFEVQVAMFFAAMGVKLPSGIVATFRRMAGEVPAFVLAGIVNLTSMKPADGAGAWRIAMWHPLVWGAVPANWVIQPWTLFQVDGRLDFRRCGYAYQIPSGVISADLANGRFTEKRSVMYAWMLAGVVVGESNHGARKMARELYRAVQRDEHDVALRLFAKVILMASAESEEARLTAPEAEAVKALIAKVRSFGCVPYDEALSRHQGQHEKLLAHPGFMTWALCKERVVA